MNEDAYPSTSTGSSGHDLTLLLLAWKHGDASAFERLAHAVHQEFLRMAGARLRGHDPLTLTRGDVVNEAMLRLMQASTDWQNRDHFFAIASLTMRSVLREHARARLADKRGGQRVQMTLDDEAFGEESMAADLLTLDALLTQLSHDDERSARVLEMSYFNGLQREAIAEVLDISVPTVDRELRFARAWLAEQLGRELQA
ncbi:ECF-type sigma factor [Paucibacter sp. APW11]|uniref:ECF-type sigma factor n=1 Tax=Roseateles aquae TaxID=3077235 RepID=A0ABU3P796_9BURK|nr:ECF-type sigma factor [Paucibacter sp. APW11]MDT8998420.1 ECF-type sigma factor [Paucibacter sp. APW11]